MEDKFHELTSRKDISMVLVTQDCAEMIRKTVDDYTNSGKVIPTVLEIPSKDIQFCFRVRRVLKCSVFFLT